MTKEQKYFEFLNVISGLTQSDEKINIYNLRKQYKVNNNTMYAALDLGLFTKKDGKWKSNKNITTEDAIAVIKHLNTKEKKRKQSLKKEKESKIEHLTNQINLKEIKIKSLLGNKKELERKLNFSNIDYADLKEDYRRSITVIKDLKTKVDVWQGKYKKLKTTTGLFAVLSLGLLLALIF